LIQKQIELIRLRNTHPAFAGELQIAVPTESRIQIQWQLKDQWIKLHADLSVPSASIEGTGIHRIDIPNGADDGAQL